MKTQWEEVEVLVKVRMSLQRVLLILLLIAIPIISLGCNSPPVAQISVVSTTAKVGETVFFSGVDSADPDTNIVSYEWNFGDGNTAFGASVSHSYYTPGSFAVKLTVIESDGLANTAELVMKVVVAKILIKATSWTWREDSDPHDICSAIKYKLEGAGIEVIPQGSNLYDAVLLADYMESKGQEYSAVPVGGVTFGYGTDISCSLRLYNEDNKLILERNISASTSSPVSIGALYSNAISNFKNEPSFRYLGDIVASRCGISDDVLIETLIRDLNDPQPNTRAAAAEVLGAMGCDRAIEPLIAASGESNYYYYEAACAVSALGDIGGEKAVLHLLTILGDPANAVRIKAAEALGKTGNKRAVEPLIGVLKDSGPEIRLLRQSVAKALGEIGDKRAVEPLIAVLTNTSGYDFLRESVAKALGEIGDKRAVEPLIAVLTNTSNFFFLRQNAAKALGEIGDKRAVEALTTALNDSYSHVREAAAESLDKINQHRVNP